MQEQLKVASSPEKVEREKEDSFLEGGMHVINRRFQLWSHNASQQKVIQGALNESATSKQTNDYVRDLVLRNNVKMDDQVAINPQMLDFVPILDSKMSLSSYQDMKSQKGSTPDKNFTPSGRMDPEGARISSQEAALEKGSSHSTSTERLSFSHPEEEASSTPSPPKVLDSSPVLDASKHRAKEPVDMGISQFAVSPKPTMMATMFKSPVLSISQLLTQGLSSVPFKTSISPDKLAHNLPELPAR
jgi:hypothetical protein